MIGADWGEGGEWVFEMWSESTDWQTGLSKSDQHEHRMLHLCCHLWSETFHLSRAEARLAMEWRFLSEVEKVNSKSTIFYTDLPTFVTAVFATLYGCLCIILELKLLRCNTFERWKRVFLNFLTINGQIWFIYQWKWSSLSEVSFSVRLCLYGLGVC